VRLSSCLRSHLACQAALPQRPRLFRSALLVASHRKFSMIWSSIRFGTQVTVAGCTAHGGCAFPIPHFSFAHCAPKVCWLISVGNAHACLLGRRHGTPVGQTCARDSSHTACDSGRFARRHFQSSTTRRPVRRPRPINPHKRARCSDCTLCTKTTR
jgi:hypothetical protein